MKNHSSCQFALASRREKVTDAHRCYLWWASVRVPASYLARRERVRANDERPGCARFSSAMRRGEDEEKKLSFVLHLFIEIFSFVKKHIYIYIRSFQLVKKKKMKKKKRRKCQHRRPAVVGLFVVVPPRQREMWHRAHYVHFRAQAKTNERENRRRDLFSCSSHSVSLSLLPRLEKQNRQIEKETD